MKTVIELEDRRFAAIVAGDKAWLSQNESSDFLYVHSTGLVETGADFRRMLDGRQRRYISMSPSQRVTRTKGTIAIVVGTLAVHAHVSDQDIHVSTRYTSVYDMQAGQIVSWHSCPAGDAERK